MPKIKIPEFSSPQFTARLDPKSIGNSIAAGGAVGGDAIDLGQMVIKASQAVSQNQGAAKSNAIYTNKLNEATLEFAKNVSERQQVTLDDDGNPKFDSLVDDIGTNGHEIMNKVSSSITDPVARAKFERSFTSHTTDVQISNLKVARQQELDFVRDSVTKGVEGLARTALSDDPSNAEEHIGRAHEIVQEALKSGAVSNQQASSILQKFEDTVRTELIRKLIKEDPEEAMKILQQAEEKNQPVDVEEVSDALE